MARARNIKPSFFTNDDLAEIHPLGRLLFIALWTMADREGRLEDRPKRIKAEALPYDDCDADALLSDLAARKFILRYQIGEQRFIQITTFGKHQNPHVKEAASTIPAPPGAAPEPAESTDSEANKDAAPDKPGASQVQAQCSTQPEPERAGLIPDSPFLIPDSGFPLPDSPFGSPAGDARNADRPCDADRTEQQKRQRGSRRCPEAFDLDDDLLDWARLEVPGLDVRRETRAFMDHEFAKPRTDWRAAWRNWMRRASEAPQRVRSVRESTEEHNRRAFAEWLGEPTDDARTIDA